MRRDLKRDEGLLERGEFRSFRPRLRRVDEAAEPMLLVAQNEDG